MTQPDFIMIPTQLLSDSSLQPSDRILFGYIYWMTKLALMKCVASNDTLSELTGFSRRGIQTSIVRLEQQGYVRRIYVGIGNSHRGEIECLVAFSAPKPDIARTNVRPSTNKRAPIARTNVRHNKKREEEHLNNKAQSALDLSKYKELEPELTAFSEVRRAQRKPLTSASLKLLIGKLESWYPSNRGEQRQCLERSIIGGWSSIYQIKEEAKPDPDVGLTPGQILHPEKYGKK